LTASLLFNVTRASWLQRFHKSLDVPSNLFQVPLPSILPSSLQVLRPNDLPYVLPTVLASFLHSLFFLIFYCSQFILLLVARALRDAYMREIVLINLPLLLGSLKQYTYLARTSYAIAGASDWNWTRLIAEFWRNFKKTVGRARYKTSFMDTKPLTPA
jgi:hypothetical protein